MSSEIYIEIFETQSAPATKNEQTHRYHYKAWHREEPCAPTEDEDNTLRETSAPQKEGTLSQEYPPLQHNKPWQFLQYNVTHQQPTLHHVLKHVNVKQQLAKTLLVCKGIPMTKMFKKQKRASTKSYVTTSTTLSTPIHIINTIWNTLLPKHNPLPSKKKIKKKCFKQHRTPTEHNLSQTTSNRD